MNFQGGAVPLFFILLWLKEKKLLFLSWYWLLHYSSQNATNGSWNGRWKMLFVNVRQCGLGDWIDKLFRSLIDITLLEEEEGKRKKCSIKKGILFLDWNDVFTTKLISYHSRLISKYFQCWRCICPCKTLLLWTILSKTTTLWEHTFSNLFKFRLFHRLIIHIYWLKSCREETSDNQNPTTIDGLSCENCILRNLFRKIYVYMNATLVSTRDNLSNSCKLHRTYGGEPSIL